MPKVLFPLDEFIIQPAARVLVTLGARHRWPSAVALGWVLLTRPVRVPGTKRRRTRGRRLIILYKLGGLEDVVAALENRGTVNIGVARLQRDDVKRVFREFMDTTLDDFNYRPHDPALSSSKTEYAEFLARTCRHYRRWLGVGAFVAANFGYFAERELATGATSIGLPFLAIHKESIRTAAQRPGYEESLRTNVGPFTGSAIAVYNEDEKASLVRSGVAEAEAIAVTGCPRLEFAPDDTASDQTSPLQDRVVYFAIDPVAGTRTFAPDENVRRSLRETTTLSQPIRWDNVASLLERELCEVAKGRPQVEFVIKVKLGRKQQVAERLADTPLPPNIRVTGKGLAPQYLTSARIVIGLNTTALIEALAARRHVVVPRFGEAGDASNRDYLFDLGTSVSDVYSVTDLGPTIDRLLQQPLPTSLTDDAKATIRRYLGNDDGEAKDRIYVWIQANMARR